MTGLIVGLIAVVSGAVLLYRRGAYYGRIFAPAHFWEVYSTFMGLIEAEREAQRSGDQLPRPSRAVTSAGLVLGVTYRSDGDDPVLHISLSQQGRATTGAVANRFGFFLLSAVNGNKLSLDPFFTGSGVHHLVFKGALAPLAVNDFDTTFDAYRSSYRPLAFALRAFDHPESAQ